MSSDAPAGLLGQSTWCDTPALLYIMMGEAERRMLKVQQDIHREPKEDSVTV